MRYDTHYTVCHPISPQARVRKGRNRGNTSGNSPAAEGGAGKGTAREQNRAASPPDGTTPAKRKQKL